MLETFGSVLEHLPGKEYIGYVLKIMALAGTGLLAVFGVLYKLNKVPFDWVANYVTAFRTRKGDLPRAKKTSERKGVIAGELKRTGHGLVGFVPYFRPLEQYDHREKPQRLDTIVIEMLDYDQRATQPLIYSRIGERDEDILKVRARMDTDAQVRGVMGMAISQAIRAAGTAVLDDPSIDLAAYFTEMTWWVRVKIYMEFGIHVTYVTFPDGIGRTLTGAIRLSGGAPLGIIAAASQNGAPALTQAA